MPDEQNLEQEESQEQEQEETEVESTEDEISAEAERDESDEPKLVKPKKDHLVPAHELAKERTERKALEAKVFKGSQDNQLLRQRLDAILQKLNEVPEQAEQAPVYEEDPAAYLKWQNDKLLEDRKQETEKRAKDEHENAQVQQVRQMQQAVKQGINQFAETTPDYNDAAKFLIDSRIREMETLGIVDKTEQLQALQLEEIQVGQWATQRGLSPGQLIYDLAKSRGYTVGKPAGNLDMVKKGQGAATSLSKGGGGAEGEMTTEGLLAMEQDDFENMVRGKKWNKLFGR